MEAAKRWLLQHVWDMEGVSAFFDLASGLLEQFDAVAAKATGCLQEELGDLEAVMSDSRLIGECCVQLACCDRT